MVAGHGDHASIASRAAFVRLADSRSSLCISDGMNRQVTLGRPWTPEEDEQLINAVRFHGDNTDKWKIIALAVPGRTNKACRKVRPTFQLHSKSECSSATRQRWLHSLCPSVKKCAWSAEEDQLLLSLFEKHPNKWSQIARGVPGRTDDACSKRYREALDPKLKKGEWTIEEDYHLIGALVRQADPSHPKWGAIGQELQRSGLACRNRWRLLERKRISGGGRALISPSQEANGAELPGLPNDWARLEGGGTGLWDGQWNLNPLDSSAYSDFDQALDNLMRQHAMADSSGSSSVRTVVDDQGMTFEPLNDAWTAGNQQNIPLPPDLLSPGEEPSQGATQATLTIDPSLSNYAASAPEPTPTDGFDNMRNGFDMDMQFQPVDFNPSDYAEGPGQQQLQPSTDAQIDAQDQTPPRPEIDAGLNRLGALADAASALSPSPCPPTQTDAPAEVPAVPSRKRRRTTADPAIMANLNVIDIGPQKPAPKLSSSLPVGGEYVDLIFIYLQNFVNNNSACSATILAYACGDSSCWPSTTSSSSARYATSGELLSHFKDVHMSKLDASDETPFKCGLQGCSKGCKVCLAQ